MRNFLLKFLLLTLTVGLFNDSIANDFSDFEIRVIRPRYFNKDMRLELGANFNASMNQTFIYTYALGGSATFHLTNSWAIEGAGNFGFSVDKDDKSTLKDGYGINTLIVRQQYDVTGSLLWTPIYGKYQLSSGRLIYFDTFISAGAGLVGVEWAYDHCPRKADVPVPQQPNVTDPPAANTQGYFGYVVGLGQRYFLSQKLALKWDVKARFFNYDAVDGACGRDALKTQGATQDKSHTSVNLGIGVSYFL